MEKVIEFAERMKKDSGRSRSSIEEGIRRTEVTSREKRQKNGRKRIK